MSRERTARPKGPPPGEYVVRHERPYPEKLDRVFRIGAVVGAIVAGLGAVGWYHAATGYEMTAVQIGMALLTVGATVAATAYAAVRAVGLIATAIVTGLRRKAYVVDYEERS